MTYLNRYKEGTKTAGQKKQLELWMRPLKIEFRWGQQLFFSRLGHDAKNFKTSRKRIYSNLSIFQDRGRPQGNINKMESRLFPKDHDFPRARPPAGQHEQNDKQYLNKANVNKVNVQVKVNVKVNVNKVNDKVNDIYSIHSHYSHYKGNHRRSAAAVRPRHLFCGGGQRPPPL